MLERVWYVSRDYSQLDGTFPGAHTQNQAKVDVLAALRNILVAKLLNDLEKLLEVEILCTCHDVNHVVEFVGFVLYGCQWTAYW